MEEASALWSYSRPGSKMEPYGLERLQRDEASSKYDCSFPLYQATAEWHSGVCPVVVFPPAGKYGWVRASETLRAYKELGLAEVLRISSASFVIHPTGHPVRDLGDLTSGSYWS